MEIAKTILEQLGGSGRLRMFTGANNFVALKNGVTFKIKNRKVNFIKITLNSLDLYDVYFYKLAAGNLKLISEHNDIYFDELIPLFEKQTGMYLSLYMKGGKIKKDESRDMIFSQLKQIHHHEKELQQIIAKDDNIEPWVIAKMARATSDLSDITHYEDGKTDKMGKGGQVDEDLVVFSVDDEKLDTLLHKNYHKNLDYITIKNDEYYTLNKRDFDRFIDSGDFNGFDVDYENSEDAVVYVIENVDKKEKGGSIEDEKESLLNDNSFTKLLFNNEIKFLRNSDTKVINRGTMLIITDGKREMLFNSTNPISKIKKLGNASNSTKELFKIDKMEDGGGITTANELGFKNEQVKDFDDVKKGDVCVSYTGILYEVITTGYGSEYDKKVNFHNQLWIAEERTKGEDFDEMPLISVKGKIENSKNKVFGIYSYDNLGALVYVDKSNEVKKIIDVIDSANVWGELYLVSEDLEEFSDNEVPLNKKECIATILYVMMNSNASDIKSSLEEQGVEFKEETPDFDFEDVEFKTEGDYELEYPDFEEKLKILNKYIDFDKVKGYSNSYVTSLYFYKNGKNIANLGGKYDDKIETYKCYLWAENLTDKSTLNFHPYDGMGGFSSYEFEKQVKQAVEKTPTTSIPGLDCSKELSSSDITFLYGFEPKLNDPYYPKELIYEIADVSYWRVMIKGSEYLLAIDKTGEADDKWYLVNKSVVTPVAIKEPGSAEIKIELLNGNVTVTHGDSGEVLLNLQDVPKGTWDKLWDFLRNKLV